MFSLHLRLRQIRLGIVKSKTLETRILNKGDQESLFNYLNSLSSETRSAFAPHPFDYPTCKAICEGIYDQCFAIATFLEKSIIAYLIIKKGHLEHDIDRLRKYKVNLDPHNDYTIAPSVADKYQSQGIGSHIMEWTIAYLSGRNVCNIILWGGVQEKNQRAVNFYLKYGFKQVGTFEHRCRNLDMFLTF